MCNANIICSFCWYLGWYSIPTIASYDEKYTQRGHGFSPCPLIFLLGWCTLGGAVVPTAPTKQTSAPAKQTSTPAAWLVHLRQVHPLKAPPERLLNKHLLHLAVSRANDVQTLLELRQLNTINREECCCTLCHCCSVDACFWSFLAEY